MGLLDIFKKKPADASPPADKPGAGGLSDSMKKLFSQPAGQAPFANDFKAEKKAISEYKTTLREEAERRQSSTTPIAPGPPGSGLPEPPKPSLAAVAARPTGQPVPEAPDAPAEPAHKRDFKISKEAIMGKFKDAKAWRAPSIIKTNLIQGQAGEVPDWRSKQRLLAAAFIAPALVVMAVYAALTLWERQARIEARLLTGKLMELNIQANKAEKESAAVDRFQDKLKALSQIIDGHAHWTNFFALLERAILPDNTILGGFTGDRSGSYKFKMRANDYAGIVKQVEALRREPLVKSASVNDASVATDGRDASGGPATVTYQLDLELDPAVFLRGRTADR